MGERGEKWESPEKGNGVREMRRWHVHINLTEKRDERAIRTKNEKCHKKKYSTQVFSNFLLCLLLEGYISSCSPGPSAGTWNRV